ncbi:hypothetical protein D3C71_1336640 [compost metagenome]
MPSMKGSIPDICEGNEASFKLRRANPSKAALSFLTTNSSARSGRFANMAAKSKGFGIRATLSVPGIASIQKESFCQSGALSKVSRWTSFAFT